MVAAIDRNPGQVAASGHILGYYPINRKIKEMADAGEFGEIFYMEGITYTISNLKAILRGSMRLWGRTGTSKKRSRWWVVGVILSTC